MTLIRNKKFLPNLQKTQYMEWVILINVVPALNIVPDFLVKKKRKRILVHTNVDKYETKGPIINFIEGISQLRHKRRFNI